MKIIANRKNNRQRSGTMAEFAAAIALLIPVTLASGFVAFQVSQVYMIKVTLDHAAQTAARRLAIAYGQDPVTAMAFPESVFEQIKCAGIVLSSDQFSIPEGTAGWNTTGDPATVTVEVVFQGGKYGLPPFPNPDPLNLGSDFSITSKCISRLE